MTEPQTSAQSETKTSDAETAIGAPPEPQEHGRRVAYEFTIDVASESTHATVVRMVGRDKKVLELGPATGYMSEVMTANGCSVTGIELDPRMAAQASEHTQRMIVGDLDTLDLDHELGEERFDVIVAADVLEHLKDPLDTLLRLRQFLTRDEGYFVVSLPNVAHGSVRLALMSGRFEYRDLGLLDRTHLRFFTRESIEGLCEEADLAIVEMRRQLLNIEASEVAFEEGAVAPEIISALNEDADAHTYQYVFSAYPIADPATRRLLLKVRELEVELEAARRALGAEEREGLADALATIAAREGELRTALVDAHDQLLRRDEEIEGLARRASELAGADRERAELRVRLDEMQKAYQEGVAERDESIRRLRVRLERILSSPPARLWSMLADLPVLRWIRERRSAGYSRAVGDRR